MKDSLRLKFSPYQTNNVQVTDCLREEGLGVEGINRQWMQWHGVWALGRRRNATNRDGGCQWSGLVQGGGHHHHRGLGGMGIQSYLSCMSRGGYLTFYHYNA
jgi:hypothetical protein